jgi:hypothetical protein
MRVLFLSLHSLLGRPQRQASGSFFHKFEAGLSSIDIACFLPFSFVVVNILVSPTDLYYTCAITNPIVTFP